MDMSQYRDLFVSESQEHIKAINDLVVQLESGTADQGVVAELFRHAHSLKGMAATMQYESIAVLAHAMEDLMSKVRSGEFSITPAMADLLLEGSDALGGMIATIEAGGDLLADNAALAERLRGFTPDSVVQPIQSEIQGKTETSADNKEKKVEEKPSFRQSDTFKSVRIKTEILDRLVNITGELITTRHGLAGQMQSCPEAKLGEPLNLLTSLLRELRDTVFQARMLPFSYVAERFPRLVRDLARKQDKEISFHVDGNDIELDRGILEDITEPLVHILRNAVDHGMETPQERVAAGKTSNGNISINLTRDKDHANIVITDDGRGMDPAILIAKALEKGLISRAQAEVMQPWEALMLVCAPGFSTAATVSDISGRGVGMDAVKSAVHNLGGTLFIESQPGHGSTFILKLPITVSIINALLVECGSLTVAFPVNAIDRALELRRNDISAVGGQMTCSLGTGSVPLKSLNHLLGQQAPRDETDCISAVLTGISGKQMGLVTDRILGQQEIFVKPLGRPLSLLPTINGGAILGDGRIVFVMDVGTFT